MISGFDNYFQIVRCFRDEDLRADRQPEFTQIDLEISFPRPETVFRVVEGFLKAAFLTIGADLDTPFPQMSYDQAISQAALTSRTCACPRWLTCVRPSRRRTWRRCTSIPSCRWSRSLSPTSARLSRKERDEIKTKFGDRKDAKVFEDIKRLEKSFPDAVARIRELTQPQADDLVVVVAGARRTEAANAVKARQQAYAVYAAAGQLRLALGQKYAERHGAFKHGNFRLLWVTDFPMFEWDEAEGRWNAAHHPFTSPHEHDMDKLEGDPGAVRALAYDVVLNGTELGSGSIRIHRQDVQAKIFKALGMSPEEQQSRFGFFLEALQYGTPPHGGIALGLDRIVMILAGAESLREVIPFPKTAKAVDLMVDAPTPVSERQLKELGIAVVGKKDL